jgi:hypothetical protein
MYHDFMNVPYTATTCYARLVFPIAFAACMSIALPLTAVNRYVVIVMRREDWFTNQRVFLLCVCSYLPLFGPLADFLFAPYVTNYLDCDFILYTPYTDEVSDILFHETRVINALFISYLTQIFCFEIVCCRHFSSEHDNYNTIADVSFRGFTVCRATNGLLHSAHLQVALTTYYHCVGKTEQDTGTNSH